LALKAGVDYPKSRDWGDKNQLGLDICTFMVLNHVFRKGVD
jgi:hypothetical protein